MGVRLILETFPEIWRGPELIINLHQGALTEGLLTFTQVLITLGLDRNIHDSFFRKTWMNSILKLALHILGSDLTGGCMNPAACTCQIYDLHQFSSSSDYHLSNPISSSYKKII
ncbi:hypothetical protein L1987_29369 [Smallanthus sonchifolius]|uniref:Uncharacterized protein n=1 Tax=Smallanthus sonchifolius TaxID=185202 RepID=A0ACB9I197_9ASTR|nr:hypothetical protein L1987_29369 [Smallanthus sonchifolius]